MDRLLLDSNILIHLVRGKEKAGELKKYVDSKTFPQLFISVVTIAEVESLAMNWKWGSRKVTVLRELVNQFIRIDISGDQRELIDAYAAIDAFSQGKLKAPTGELLNTSSRNMGKNDLWIAASAYFIGAELISTDADFDHLHEKWLKVRKF